MLLNFLHELFIYSNPQQRKAGYLEFGHEYTFLLIKYVLFNVILTEFLSLTEGVIAFNYVLQVEEGVAEEKVHSKEWIPHHLTWHGQ